MSPSSLDIENLIARLFPATTRDCSVVPFSVGDHRYNLFVDATYVFSLSAPAESIISVTFRKDDPTMAAAKGKVKLRDVDPGLGLTSRPVEVTLNGGAPVTLDMINPDVEFDCNEGDTYNVRPTGSTGPGGVGPAGDPSTGTVTIAGGPGNVPPAEVVESVTFRPAP